MNKTRSMLMICFLLVVAIVAIHNTIATIYPSYNSEQDCRSCHGNSSSSLSIRTPATRHHDLVANETYVCSDCHPMILSDSQNGTYTPELIRNCLVCHVEKNHTNVHHTLAEQGLFVCKDCHPVLFNNQTNMTYVQVTWDCTVCHSTILSIQNTTNTTPTPTPTVTPTETPTVTPTATPSPTPEPPSIIGFSPLSPVNDVEGSIRNFSITSDQIANITWFINDSHINASVGSTDQISVSAIAGVWNVSTVVSNNNGTVKFTWTWNVTSIIVIPPRITSYAPYYMPGDYPMTSRKFGLSTDQLTDMVWYINGTEVQSNLSVSSSAYTNDSAPDGLWNVTVVASNINGSVSYTWIWNTSIPKTIIDEPGLNNWYTNNIINLNASDSNGIEHTNYSIDNNWYSNTGSGTILNTGMSLSDGFYDISYYSVDTQENIEPLLSRSVKIDSTPPEIIINSPVNGTIYVLNRGLIANWSVNDNTSLVATTTASYPNGSSITTSSVGTKYFNVTSSDNAGNTNTKNITYYIRYNFGGFLPPISNNGGSIFKSGSNLPIKFQLTDGNGNWVTDAVAILNVTKVTTSVTGLYLQPYLNETTTLGDLFIYSSNGHFYMYNLGTKDMSIGTWRIRVTINDESTYEVYISIKD